MAGGALLYAGEQAGEKDGSDGSYDGGQPARKHGGMAASKERGPGAASGHHPRDSGLGEGCTCGVLDLPRSLDLPRDAARASTPRGSSEPMPCPRLLGAPA